MPTAPGLVASRPQAVEAQSLDSLNTLAGNPPQYPERPNDKEPGPLVLYISRVPGKRDVILSPFKPRARNVTRTDISNCLYYVMLGDPSSRLSAHLADGAEPRSSSEDAPPSLQTIPRKPLPDSARPLTPESLPSANRLRPPPDLLGKRDQGATAPQGSREEASPSPSSLGPIDSGLGLGADLADAPPLPTSGVQTGMPARKPVASQLGVSATTQPVPVLALDIPAPDNDALGTQPGQSGDGTAERIAAHPPAPQRRSRKSCLAGTPFTLTLVRRNPVQDAQFNVARVSSRQLDPPSAAKESTDPPTTATAPPIDVEIETSGYARFRRRPVKPKAGVGMEAALAAAAEEVGQPRSDIGVFSRRVAMNYSKSYTKSLTANIRGKLGRLERAGRARFRQGRNGRTTSIDSAMFSAPSGSEEEGVTKPRGYTFQSPWGGKCDFRTGVSGRTVRCEHTLQGAGPAVYNPLVAEQGSGVAKKGPVTAKSAKGQWRGSVDKLLRPGHEHQDDDVSPFEVHVGTERAGGGSRGRNAKLGKLIVYTDGLKMLDLLVAANMGVWWGAWERTF
ncbi:oxidoreductase-like protein [Ophiocordyceps sinensis CO18]|uniref:Oxidoreductase-like protein n=1 Tax=Ophiocordyceps sinensis (strain Co18 / CGMCC 3.14243) TaxID=911162 RepID=T5A5P1_OPHSC|nr:oxidoreductase-like protein [Ophiocordyceps sinensis CO18]